MSIELYAILAAMLAVAVGILIMVLILGIPALILAATFKGIEAVRQRIHRKRRGRRRK